MSSASSGKLFIRKSLVCPHCWSEVESPDLVWVATKEGDLKDSKLIGQPPRFQACSFNLAGNARGPFGGISTELACPNCHLEVPRAMLAQPTYFFSIFGTAGSGKSFFLTTMTRRLEHVLLKEFNLSFLMVSSRFNQRLEDLQKMLFAPQNVDEPVKLPKNQLHGDFYSQVQFGSSAVDFPVPFLYQLTPSAEHPRYKQPDAPSGVFVLYDNAGEDFEQKTSSEARPVTDHLITASVVFVIIDPFLYSRFRVAARAAGGNPPPEGAAVRRNEQEPDKAPQDQAKRLNDTMTRIRAQTNRGELEKESRPICVIVTKYDAWKPLLSEFAREPWKKPSPDEPAVLRTDVIEEVSQEVRQLLKEYAGEVVGTLERFADAANIYYFPVSATGAGATWMDDGYRVSPSEIAPIWSEVPMLYALHRWLGNFVPGKRS